MFVAGVGLLARLISRLSDIQGIVDITIKALFPTKMLSVLEEAEHSTHLRFIFCTFDISYSKCFSE